MIVDKNRKILDCFRIGIVFWICLMVHNYNFIARTFYPSLFWKPIGIIQFFSLSVFTPQLVSLLSAVLWGLLLFSLFGIFTRGALFVSGVLLTILMSYWNSFNFVSHRESCLAILLFILSAFPVGQTYSLDSKFLKGSKDVTSKDIKIFLFFVRCLFCLIYFSAGVAKLRNSGIEWVIYPTLTYYLQLAATWPDQWLHQFAPDAAYKLSLYPDLTRFLAALVLILELIVPLALFIKKLRPPIVLSLLAMQIVIFFTLKIHFLTFTILFAAWLPWERLIKDKKDI